MQLNQTEFNEEQMFTEIDSIDHSQDPFVVKKQLKKQRRAYIVLIAVSFFVLLLLITRLLVKDPQQPDEKIDISPTPTQIVKQDSIDQQIKQIDQHLEEIDPVKDNIIFPDVKIDIYVN